MPRELVAIGPSQPALRDYAEPPLQPGMLRIVSEFGSPKHGTDLKGYRGLHTEHHYDPELRCFVSGGQSPQPFPRALGNMIVGRVTDVGAGVAEFVPGDRVYGHLKLREVHVVPAEQVKKLPPEMTPEQAVCLDPADAALAMRDAKVRLGDRVAVFGM